MRINAAKQNELAWQERHIALIKELALETPFNIPGLTQFC